MSLPLGDMGDSPYGKRGKKLGDLNGPWAIAFKFVMLTYPFILTWCAWVTREQFQDQVSRGAVDALITVKSDHEARLRSQELQVTNGMAVLQTQMQATISRLSMIETKIDALVR